MFYIEFRKRRNIKEVRKTRKNKRDFNELLSYKISFGIKKLKSVFAIVSFFKALIDSIN